MGTPSGRSSPPDLTEWLADHRRLVTVGVVGLVAILAFVAAFGVVGLLRGGPGTGSAPVGGVPSFAASESAVASPEPAAGGGSPTQEPSVPAVPTPSVATAGVGLGDGWAEIASFGADEAIEAVHDVVETPFGLLAAGTHIRARNLNVFGELPQEGRIWLSSDGRSWEDVTPIGTFANASINRLVVLPDGAVAALTQATTWGDQGPSTVYVIWETMDGRTWTASEITAGGYPVLDIAVGGQGYLARVGAELGGPQLWYASDGRSFREVSDPTNGRIVNGVAAGPEGFVIIASAYESAESPTVYASGNGTDWYEAETPASQLGHAASIGPDWIALEFGPFGDLTSPVETSTWFSSNGLEWVDGGRFALRVVPLSDGFSCREFLSEIASTGSLVVVSTTLSYPCGEGHVERFGSVHVTADGATWTTLPFSAAASPSDGGTRGTLVRAGVDLDTGTLLVGENRYRATFWFRPSD